MSIFRTALLCLIGSTQAAMAEDMVPSAGSLFDEGGMFVLDYQSIDLNTGGKFDLHGFHYLHQINDWLYGGLGFSAPMFEGDYGGFFSADFTVHAQKKVFGNVFVDAGAAFGAGAGGDSVGGIKSISGDGTLTKFYGGVGYDFGSFRAGVNYAKIKIANSPINDATISFFVQKPLSFSLGKHEDTGATVDPADFGRLGNETIFSFEYSNLSQINPTGRYTGDIGLVSPHLTTFFDENNYYFVGLDLGATGLVWYNQAQVGVGTRYALADDINLYAQIGFGSGGWVTDTFDTGPGFVVYPKVKAEYMFNNTTGVFVSAGYLTAPFGSSSNWSLGAGVNFHMPSAKQAMAAGQEEDVVLNGLRASLFGRVSFNVENEYGSVSDLYSTPVQLDYKFARNWYAGIQIAPAINDYMGFAGYVEGFAGLGWESSPFLDGRLQGFGQVFVGVNDVVNNPGLLASPAVGFTYNLDDRYALYGQVSRTVSVGHLIDPTNTSFFKSTSVGLGVSYRLGMPTWSSR